MIDLFHSYSVVILLSEVISIGIYCYIFSVICSRSDGFNSKLKSIDLLNQVVYVPHLCHTWFYTVYFTDWKGVNLIHFHRSPLCLLLIFIAASITIYGRVTISLIAGDVS